MRRVKKIVLVVLLIFILGDEEESEDGFDEDVNIDVMGVKRFDITPPGDLIFPGIKST
jgi:hypothetical protein